MILVTGSGGPLGYAFQEIYQNEKRYIFPRSKNCNLEDPKSLNSFLSDQPKISGIIHLAAFSGGAHLSKSMPASMISKNLMMALNLLEYARYNEIKRVLFTLSTTCYSSKLNSPSESQLHKYPVEGIDYAYAWAKRSLDILMRAYCEQYNMEIICVVVNGIIGRRMNFDDNKSIFPAAIIKRFYDSKVQGSNDFEIYTDGSEIREYSYSNDLARAIKWCFDNQKSNTLLNIGNTERISIRNLTFQIAKKLGIDSSLIKFGKSSVTSRPIQSTDNSEFIRQSDFKYSSLGIALDDAISWYANSVK